MYAPWNVNNYLALLEDGTSTYRQADRETDRETDRGMHYRNDAFSLPVIVHVSPEGKENYKKETRGKKAVTTEQSSGGVQCRVSTHQPINAYDNDKTAQWAYNNSAFLILVHRHT